jgi:hypothetical protein
MKTSSEKTNSLHSKLRVLALLLLLSFGSEHEVRAYTDPGSGAMIWQMLVAGFVGAMFYLRRFTGWIKTKKGSKS